MPLTQASRPLAVATPLGDDILLLRSFQGQEAISRLFSFELELLSENDAIDYEKIIGQRVDVRVSLADGTQRFWNGFVSRFTQAGRDSNLTVYRATVVPWFWFLDQTTDCRIFQSKTVPTIIQQIFKEYDFHDFVLRLYGNFNEREYCVQYRESDFNFISRLMEEEGIFYFFEHVEGKHVLVLGNDPAAHKECAHQPTARYETNAGGWQDDDVVLQWMQEREYRPGVYTSTDYNFETPATSLLSTVNGKGKYEIYDFPGEYDKRADGDSLVRIRLQEQQAAGNVVRGASDCRGFGVGYKFELKEHYREDLNQTYVITALVHSGHTLQDYKSSAVAGSAEPAYRNTFEAVPISTPVRPPRRTPVPIVQGCQTAVVVGPGGEEIFTDKYGRVKVQFHWDREGKRNESSSCWIRVSHPWAGKGWGGIQIPRIGQEVIVDFIEGDPDRPIITGRVYNAGQMPPWGLPGKAVVSGFKSNSTKGGGGYNEISLDDTKGNELVHIHGQYDMDSKIEHDDRLTIGNNRTKSVSVDESTTIGNNRTEKVGVNEQITIGANRTESVGANEKITVALTRTRNVGINEMVNVGVAQEINVGGAQAVTVGAAQAITVGLARVISVGALQKITIGASLSESVGTNRSENVGANQEVKVGANLSEHIGSDQTTQIGGKFNEKIGSDQNTEVGGKLTESVTSDHTNKVGGNRETKVSSKDTLDVGSELLIKAGSQITLETGASKIVMKSGGQIEISGMSIQIKGSTSVKAEGVTINIEASGINTIKGSLVKIN
jgi:type VI secretion system secreted protein VgrG